MPKSSPQMRSLDDIDYNADDGVFTFNGKRVGTINRHGYVVLRADGKVQYAHRIAWFKVHGKWPNIIDHVNGDRKDNSIRNLRDVCATANGQNIRLKRTPKHGLPPGAHFHAPSGGFKSAIQVNGCQIHLGYFRTPEAASAAYIAAKRKYHPQWSTHYA